MRTRPTTTHTHNKMYVYYYYSCVCSSLFLSLTYEQNTSLLIFCLPSCATKNKTDKVHTFPLAAGRGGFWKIIFPKVTCCREWLLRNELHLEGWLSAKEKYISIPRLYCVDCYLCWTTLTRMESKRQFFYIINVRNVWAHTEILKTDAKFN